MEHRRPGLWRTSPTRRRTGPPARHWATAGRPTTTAPLTTLLAPPSSCLLVSPHHPPALLALPCLRRLHVPDAQMFASSRSALLLADYTELRVWHLNNTIKMCEHWRLRYTRSLGVVTSDLWSPCMVDLRTATVEVPLAGRKQRCGSCVHGRHPSRNAGSSEHVTRRAAGQRRWLRGRPESHGHSAHGPTAHAAAGAPGEGGAVPAAGASRCTSQLFP